MKTSDCCGATILYEDICSDCYEHCEVIDDCEDEYIELRDPTIERAFHNMMEVHNKKATDEFDAIMSIRGKKITMNNKAIR